MFKIKKTDKEIEVIRKGNTSTYSAKIRPVNNDFVILFFKLENHKIDLITEKIECDLEEAIQVAIETLYDDTLEVIMIEEIFEDIINEYIPLEHIKHSNFFLTKIVEEILDYTGLDKAVNLFDMTDALTLENYIEEEDEKISTQLALNKIKQDILDQIDENLNLHIFGESYSPFE